MTELFTFALKTSFGLVLALCSVQSSPPPGPLPPPPPATIQYECSIALPDPLGTQSSLVFVATGTLTGPYVEAADAGQPAPPVRNPYLIGRP